MRTGNVNDGDGGTKLVGERGEELGKTHETAELKTRSFTAEDAVRAAEEAPKPELPRLIIMMTEDGSVQCTGPLNSRNLCYAMLEGARDVIKDYNDAQLRAQAQAAALEAAKNAPRIQKVPFMHRVFGAKHGHGNVKSS